MTQTVDVRIIRFAFTAAVPTVVMVLAVAVVLAVSLIVLAVIRHEVHHREAIVCRNKVDAGLDAPSLRCVEVGRADDAFLHVGKHLFVALQETAHTITEPAVPLSPASPRRERAHLIESACIPSLGNELRLAENGVMRQRFEQGWIGHGMAVLVAP